MPCTDLACNTCSYASTHHNYVRFLNSHHLVYKGDKVLSILDKQFLSRVFVSLVDAVTAILHSAIIGIFLVSCKIF